MRKTSRSTLNYRSARSRRFSVLAIVGVLVPVVLVLIAGVAFVLPRLGTHAAAPAVNMNCTLIVPSNPLAAQGLATPFQLTATDPNQGPCNESNPNQAVFVQGAVIDPATGQISIYNPLVIDKGTRPAKAPVVPKFPNRDIVALWGGGNDNVTTLQDTQGSLQAGNCVNGLNGSPFGQVWYCNAPAFFQAANQAIAAGKLKPPPLGMAKDRQPCPTVRDFSVVDQDQSDNVTTDYLVVPNTGQTAQMTAANVNALPGATTAANGSDNRLLDAFIDKALGCQPWTAPDLADNGNPVPAQPLNEIQAAMYQANPVALVPLGDPMVLVNGHPSLRKLNAYRAGVDQALVQNPGAASTQAYCASLLATAPQRIQLDANMALTTGIAGPDPAVANSLFTFLAQRFVFTYENNGLNCQKLLHKADPVKVQTANNGVAISATINGNSIGGGGTGNDPVNCSINGTVLTGCSGTTTINGQTCSFTLDQNANEVKITCPAKG